MFQTIKAYLAKLSSYPRLRILLIILAVIIAFIFIMNVLSPTRDTNATPPSSVEAAAPGSTPATSVPKNNATQYQQLANTAQQQAVQQASQSGGTIFENAFNQNTNGAANSAAPQNQNNTAQNASTPNDISPEAFSAAQQAQKQGATGQNDAQNTANPQDAALSAQVQSLQQQLSTAQEQQQAQQKTQIQTAMGNIEASMRNGLQNISSSWNLPTQATVGGAPASTPGTGSSTSQPPVSIKAGSILFGVIDTALDSDQSGTPVLAHIVEGPLQGARLMGGFTLSGKALVVQFNTMSLPSSPASFGINAYAVDAKTANNSVATSVNNHYLLRYGMLFAAAFLQGFGNAYQNYTYNCPPGTQNCSVVNTNSSGITTQNSSVTTSEAFYQGLGQIGTNVGQAAAQEFNTPPTVKVASGTGIGVLFMSDVRVPIN